MDSSMVEENGSSAIGDPIGGGGRAGGANVATGSAVAEVSGGGRDPSGAQLNDNSSTSSNSASSNSTAATGGSAVSGAGGGGSGGGVVISAGGATGNVNSPVTVDGAVGPEAALVSLAAAATVAAAATNIVQILPTSQTAGQQVQSVIQANQQSVIQTATANVPITRGVLLVCNKPNSVIHTTTGNLQAIHIKPEPHIGTGPVTIMTDTNSDDTLSDEEASPKKRRDLLTRRPSYRKILNDLGGAEIVMGGNVQLEDQSRKREMRLQKNREAARECRRKKKEYIKCLENRVAVLENQNKALIEELKSLKELYCAKSD
ncbi:cyclic AMP response element-binding protein B isoform X3 [Anopheles cruzii]|uniref:cyclic AMP response element-binding protein B isoform X3 n=1 Tax=Anopheles cruzii TaxID=68878 RepID=UPI0022EC2172|nr:cyclic AMP response element-binding protein B isoform X3 [Anopheles cruzii]